MDSDELSVPQGTNAPEISVTELARRPEMKRGPSVRAFPFASPLEMRHISRMDFDELSVPQGTNAPEISVTELANAPGRLASWKVRR